MFVLFLYTYWYRFHIYFPCMSCFWMDLMLFTRPTPLLTSTIIFFTYYCLTRMLNKNHIYTVFLFWIYHRPVPVTGCSLIAFTYTAVNNNSNKQIMQNFMWWIAHGCLILIRMQYSFEHGDSQRYKVYENETILEEKSPLSKFHHTLTPMRLRHTKQFPTFCINTTFMHTTNTPHRVNKPLKGKPYNSC